MKNKLLLLILISMLCVSCTSTNKKLETHPTGETNELKALDKFWELLRPLRILNGTIAEFN
tara:strand:+ start:586 stop:768 length:183 start_codon:yes stop_codon:yes gene_type:complete